MPVPSKSTKPALQVLRAAISRGGLFLPFSILLVGCGGGSGGNENSVLPQAEAQQVMGENLNDVTKNAEVTVGFSPLADVTCANLGTYNVAGVDYLVCQIYDRDGAQGVPKISPNVDLVSRIPAGSAEQIRASVKSDLENAEWSPVLATPTQDFGIVQIGTGISGQFDVRGDFSDQISGQCDIINADGSEEAFTDLVTESSNGRVATLKVSDPNGFGLLAGEYSFKCTFEEGMKQTIVENAGSFEITDLCPPGSTFNEIIHGCM